MATRTHRPHDAQRPVCTPNFRTVARCGHLARGVPDRRDHHLVKVGVETPAAYHKDKVRRVTDEIALREEYQIVSTEPSQSQIVTGSRSPATGAAMSTTTFGELFTELVDPTLWLVTAANGGERGGLIATFVVSASLVPDEPRVAIGIAKHHFTWRLIDRSRAFALHLVDLARPEWVRRFGLRSGREADKFAGLAPEVGATGAPLLADALLWSECVVEAALDTGDRSLFLGRVTRFGQGPPGRPLTMSAMSKALEDADRRELADRLARDIAADAAAIREWRNLHRPS